MFLRDSLIYLCLVICEDWTCTKLVPYIICCVELAVLFDVVPNWHPDD